LPHERVLRVQGLASSMLLKPNEPADPANRRISIIVMNRDAEDRFFGRLPEQDVPDAAQGDEAAPSTSPEPSR
jgi:chemotaxis protein MotB